MKTLSRPTKKTVRKTTSSHSTKVALKRNGKNLKPIANEFNRSYYDEKTLTSLYAVSSSYFKSFTSFEAKSLNTKLELISLIKSMLNEAKANHLTIHKSKVRKVVYHFTEYHPSEENKTFEMALGRLINQAYELFENAKWTISNKGQLLDENKKVVSVKAMNEKRKAKGEVAPRPTATGKNETSKKLSELIQALGIIESHKGFIKDVEQIQIAQAILTLQTHQVEGIVEAKEDPNPQMKGIGKMPKNISFANPKAQANA